MYTPTPSAFARGLSSFEKKKRLQELQAAKHIDLGDGEDGLESDSDSETEDEDAEMLTPTLDLQVLINSLIPHHELRGHFMQTVLPRTVWASCYAGIYRTLPGKSHHPG